MSLRTFAIATFLFYAVVAPAQTADWMQRRQAALDLRQQGRLTEALETSRRLLAESERHEPGAVPLALALHDYAMVAGDLAQTAEAERALRRAIVVEERTPGHDPGVIQIFQFRLAEIYLDAGRLSEAKPLFLELEQVWGETQPRAVEYAMTLDHLGWLAVVSKQYDEAETRFRRSITLLETASPPPPYARLADALNDYGSLLFARKRYAEAGTWAERAQSVLKGRGDVVDSTTINTWTLLAGAYAFSGRTREGEEHIHRAVASTRSLFGDDSLRTGRLLVVAGGVLRRCGQNREAKELRKEGAQILAKADRENPGRFTVDVNALR